MGEGGETVSAQLQDPGPQELLAAILVELRKLVAATPTPRTWTWRLNNLIWLGVTVAGAVAGAAAGWWFSKL
jgi:hypothetical protein